MLFFVFTYRGLISLVLPLRYLRYAMMYLSTRTPPETVGMLPNFLSRNDEIPRLSIARYFVCLPNSAGLLQFSFSPFDLFRY